MSTRYVNPLNLLGGLNLKGSKVIKYDILDLKLGQDPSVRES